MSTDTTPNARILVVDDEANIRRVLSVLLKHENHDVETVASGKECLKALEEAPYDLVISDIRMSGMDGLSLLKEIKARPSSPPVILMTAFGTTDTAIEAIKAGAYDYFSKPIQAQEMLHRVGKALQERRLSAENRGLRQQMEAPGGFSNIIGSSPAMLKIYESIRRVANFKSTVLITGESGTGKELVARAVHDNSPRAKKPFIALNCGALPRELVESELFGHSKGAFSGAHAQKAGLFEAAEGGTLFLDEIGDLDASSQVKLLRALQESEVRRVGSTDPIKVDVRVIAATERDLSKELDEGNFRESLYYRLNVVPIPLPPLRDRKEDIPALARHFIVKVCKQAGVEPLEIGPRAMEALLAYEWPGNVRELENVLERSVVMSDGDGISIDSLPRSGTPEVSSGGLRMSIPEGELNLKETMRRITELVEREMICRALDQVDRNRTKTAEVLGISQRSLLYKLKEYGID